MLEAGKFLLNRLVGWWDGLSPAEQKVYGGLWAVAGLLLLVNATPDSWPMIVALGGIGGYFLMQWRKAQRERGDAAPAEKATTAAATPAAKPAAASKPAPKTAPKPAAAAPGGLPGAAPKTLSAPRGGKADDLKMLKGVGPRLESILNEMGFFHYDQIAAWTPEEVAWVDEAMSGVNKGRASRDGWVSQARVLAGGGLTPFAQRVAEGEVPTSQG